MVDFNILKKYEEYKNGLIRIGGVIKENDCETEIILDSLLDVRLKHFYWKYFIDINTNILWEVKKINGEYYLQKTNQKIKNYNKWGYEEDNNILKLIYCNYPILSIKINNCLKHRFFNFLVHKLNQNKDILNIILQQLDEDVRNKLIELDII